MSQPLTLSLPRPPLPHLLLLPGLDGTGEMFEPFLPHLPPGTSFTIVRYPRERFLPYPELAALAFEAAPRGLPLALVAESYSGPVALELSRLPGLDIRAFVFSTTFARSPWPLLVSLSRFLPLGAVMRIPRPKLYARLTTLDLTTPQGLVDQLVEVNRSVSPAVLAARIRSLHGIDYRPHLRDLAVPCLYLRARPDHTVPAGNERPFTECVRDLTLVTVDGPHLLLQSRPAECASAIIPFLSRL